MNPSPGLGASGPPGLQRAFRLALALGLAAYGWFLARRPGHFGFLDNIDLAIHETGHMLFLPFGEVAHVLGGTLFQLIVPLLFLGYFARRRDWFAAAIPLWWVGQNLFNIARYISDARAQELPLVGGGEHDWLTLLDHWSVLQHDILIAGYVHAAGVWMVLGAATLATWFAIRGGAPVPHWQNVR
jgi:hypothetical protein